jgi:hypothetical protein
VIEEFRKLNKWPVTPKEVESCHIP